MYRVVKKMHFSYGHRLLGYEGKCAHPHGHNGEVELEIEGEALDDTGMLVDFGEISRRLATFIDTQLDHLMLLQQDDPLTALLEELGEPVFKMDVPPTAENIARLIFLEARALGLPVTAVRLWETPRACAEYREQS